MQTSIGHGPPRPRANSDLPSSVAIRAAAPNPALPAPFSDPDRKPRSCPPEDLLGDDGLFKQLKKALLERALGAELSDHLGYEKADPAGRGTGSSRNGHSDKTVLTEDGAVELAVPRDRNGSFEPVIVPKGERRLDGFDDRILSLYAHGMTVREIRGHLQELYGVAVSPDLISRVTDAVLDEVREHAGDFCVCNEGEAAQGEIVRDVPPVPAATAQGGDRWKP